MRFLKPKRQQGFAIVELAIILIALLAVGGIGYWALTKSKADDFKIDAALSKTEAGIGSAIQIINKETDNNKFSGKYWVNLYLVNGGDAGKTKVTDDGENSTAANQKVQCKRCSEIDAGTSGTDNLNFTIPESIKISDQDGKVITKKRLLKDETADWTYHVSPGSEWEVELEYQLPDGTVTINPTKTEKMKFLVTGPATAMGPYLSDINPKAVPAGTGDVDITFTSFSVFDGTYWVNIKKDGNVYGERITTAKLDNKKTFTQSLPLKDPGNYSVSLTDAAGGAIYPVTGNSIGIGIEYDITGYEPSAAEIGGVVTLKIDKNTPLLDKEGYTYSVYVHESSQTTNTVKQEIASGLMPEANTLKFTLSADGDKSFLKNKDNKTWKLQIMDKSRNASNSVDFTVKGTKQNDNPPSPTPTPFNILSVTPNVDVKKGDKVTVKFAGRVLEDKTKYKVVLTPKGEWVYDANNTIPLHLNTTDAIDISTASDINIKKADNLDSLTFTYPRGLIQYIPYDQGDVTIFLPDGAYSLKVCYKDSENNNRCSDKHAFSLKNTTKTNDPIITKLTGIKPSSGIAGTSINLDGTFDKTKPYKVKAKLNGLEYTLANGKMSKDGSQLTFMWPKEYNKRAKYEVFVTLSDNKPSNSVSYKVCTQYKIPGISSKIYTRCPA